ncbi:ABC transporter ATP-binding protein [Nocardiopsis sp. N85]|uniref:ABC transporter ATP-binding protein n=1 Tax=Nocardiopsis sp. N85 TaxID=3029400 RepID=UPI00237EF557|nr:ABC transporter ATP-binding protein [Nocardiopsis sp. N85]MDE3723104.1 ABC transporter ATP-binding protein [Nocardiopsis sp. N85]
MANDVPSNHYRILPELVKGNGGTVAAVALLALVSGAATLVLPLVAARLISALQTGGDLLVWGIGLVAIGLGATVTSSLSSYLLARTAQGMIYRLRVRTMGHGFRARIRDTQRLGTGNLATRLTADAASVKGAIDVGPVQLPMAFLMLLGTMVIMAILDWVLLLVTLAAFAVAIVAVGAVIVALRRHYTVLQGALGTLSERFVDALESLQIIKAGRAEHRVLGELDEEADRVRRVEIRVARLESMLSPILNLGQQIALVSVLIGGGVRLVGGDLTLAAFVAFLMYLLQLATPLMTAVSGFSTLQAGLAARERFNEVFDLEEEDRGGRSTAPTDPAARGNAVHFTGVEFSYDDEPVLRGVDLRVPARGLTSIVGPSGAGKSTVLGLIEGFMEPDAGRIDVLGRDHGAWPLDELRGHIGYVDQRFTLLRGTIRTNLTLGLTTVPDDGELYRALEKVSLDDVVRALPNGLDTRLGNGTDLSGGQRQRLALARTLMSDDRLVLLDEPTSQLDSLSEARLRSVVDELARDRAVLVVAHRISTVRQADHVIVMEDGRVVDQGTHDRLLDDCPSYAALVKGQTLTAPEPSLI